MTSMLKKTSLQQIKSLQTSKADWITSKKLTKIMDLLEAQAEEDLTDRSSEVHFSASALVFKGDQLFFIYHPYLKTTLLPAGHVEAGESPVEAAMREFQEETGFQVDESKCSRLVDVNLFDIPANPVKAEGRHCHIDFRFLFILKEKGQQEAELPFKLLTQTEAPEEFKPYFELLGHEMTDRD